MRQWSIELFYTMKHTKVPFDNCNYVIYDTLNKLALLKFLNRFVCLFKGSVGDLVNAFIRT